MINDFCPEMNGRKLIPTFPGFQLNESLSCTSPRFGCCCHHRFTNYRNGVFLSNKLRRSAADEENAIVQYSQRRQEQDRGNAKHVWRESLS